ncbi:hypothetical protein RhiirA1_482695 [Rhizophagus irregularis]|uniref:Uncharacterized protein n=1 Tax=Rhizophagus irregularis TaxID=588596 RepID=A0A2I1FPD9_9GLOM|nr:hypothetical protein RhiirA1_482695 [Rhizophagus irregularis]PKY36244.1 hypothetical protein RhiirB3_458417 [Rhizophagus irregularis]
MVGLFDSKEVLYENGIFTSSPTSKPLFSYISFCKVLSVNLIHYIISSLLRNCN